jgi:hypothetical protein
MDAKTVSLVSTLAVAILSACGGDDGGASTPPAVVLSDSLPLRCVQLVNGYRATVQLPPLAVWTDSVGCLAGQAGKDATADKAHGNFGMCKEAAQNTCPGWVADTSRESLADVVGRCVESMWSEGPGSDYSKHGHYTNMTNPKYAKLGCAYDFRQGSLWINMDFK